MTALFTAGRTEIGSGLAPRLNAEFGQLAGNQLPVRGGAGLVGSYIYARIASCDGKFRRA
jgi:hypothetical protein